MGEELLFSTEAAPDPLIGRTLDGRYQVLAELGTGGGGVVYRGRQVQLGRMVAIKTLDQHRAVLPEWRRRFQREAKALSELAHPNIVTVTDFGIHGDVPYLVMELLEGKTLAKLLAEGLLPPARAFDIARQALRGLAFAHGKAIVHRDLKPANVFLQSLPDHLDHLKLLDFGTAKFLEDSASPTLVENLTRVGMVFGTPAYMSPEQARGEVVDARTDVYAMGVLLFELFAGRLPFVGPTPEAMMKAHDSDPVPSLARARPDLAAAPLLQPLVERSLAKHRAGRFPDAASMLAALEAVAAVSRVATGAAGGEAQLLTDMDRPPAGWALRAGRFVSGSWRSVATMVSLAAGLTTVVSFVRRDPGRLTAGSATGFSVPADPSRRPVPQPARATRPPARDPWRDPIPGAMQSIRDKLDRQVRVPEASLRPAYNFARQNPGDPRPWLLVGRAYAQLDWLSDSVERYLHAYHLDASSRGDPQMLLDLVKAAAYPSAARSAAKAVEEIFGPEAIPVIAEAMNRRGGDREAIARLSRLKEDLAR